MDLELLAISDTHLGEETSLLCFPHGRWALWRALRELFGEGAAVNELVLLGDIPDRTLSSTAQIVTQTNAFMQTLGSALDIKKAIYVPGNHDHTLWSSYARGRSPTTPIAGELVIDKGALVPDVAAAAGEILTVFFGYPEGGSWRSITQGKTFDFAVANPVYARSFKDRSYVFAHGTHFRPDVTLPKGLKELADYLQADRVLGRIEIEAGGDINRAKNLEELEKIVTPFVDSLWPSSKNNPTSHSDQLWYVLTYISGKFKHTRPAPQKSEKFTWAALETADRNRIDRLTPEYAHEGPIALRERYGNKSIDLCRRYFLDHAIDHVVASGLSGAQVTFVYGDTHEGGFGRLPTRSGSDVRVYNTGAWVVHNADHHPPCHLFAVDTDGVEYLVDVSFDGVMVDGEPLLSVASEDAENKKRTSSKLLRLALSLLPTPH